MSGALRDTAFAIARAGPLPVPPAERLLATEREAAQPRRTAPGSRRRATMKARSVVWDAKGDAAARIAAALAADRPSVDRTIVYAYLRRYPVDHAAFSALARAAAIAARRLPAWAERGDHYRLWSIDGPETLATALLEGDTLHDAGLDGDLSEGGFVDAALRIACARVAGLSGADAERGGARLVALFATLRVRPLDGSLAQALLAPWIACDPTAPHRRAIRDLLIRRIGAPDRVMARWTVAARAMPGDPAAVIAVLRRWG